MGSSRAIEAAALRVQRGFNESVEGLVALTNLGELNQKDMLTIVDELKKSIYPWLKEGT